MYIRFLSALDICSSEKLVSNIFEFLYHSCMHFLGLLDISFMLDQDHRVTMETV